MILRLYILALCGFCSAAIAEQNLLDDAQAAIAYVYGDDVQKHPYEELDLVALDHAADVLNRTIESHDLPLERAVVLHQVLIKALTILNFARIELDQTVHIAQLENGLEKVDKLIEHYPNISDLGDMLFESGHIARFLLEAPRLGYKYWHLCANQAHAGCMNILAFNYFSGGYGIRQDIEKSYYWHNQTYLTGTRFHCAGVYSARKAREILFLFPEVSDNKRWQDWNPEIDELIQQLEDINEDSPANMCGKGQGLLKQYLYELTENNEQNIALLMRAKNTIKLAQTSESEGNIVEAFDIIGRPDFFDKSINLLRKIEDPFIKCSIAFNHILYSQALKASQHSDTVFTVISELDSEVCKEHITSIELMQTKGTW
ncbi:hypothetical protein Q4574_06470 [Aliiglaciecola sp. 3_MG-2023]|uniref:hypothetical protein n=1 Tax=Aliiglaciecola sp. 3_MG-2023 TaxID=3062644 RepID=UPI0026E3118C|nr:hypothetical protein [Aliiglaciecola sp. 3_MG-2023]MDO6692920.1 hypothetical protein [Aliiglaciecola sp. 3_MG-2023]